MKFQILMATSLLNMSSLLAATNINFKLPKSDLVLQAEINDHGGFRINNLPSQYNAKIQFIQINGGGGVVVQNNMAETCKNVKNSVTLISLPNTTSSTRERAITRVREMGEAFFDFQLVPFLNVTVVQNAVMNAAQAQGINFANFEWLNPITVEEISTEIAIANDSYTMQIGDHEPILNDFKKSFAKNLIINNFNSGSLNALDLMCDLVNQKAIINFSIKGKYKNSTPTVTNITSDIAKDIYNDIKKDLSRLDVNQNDAPTNAILAGFFMGKTVTQKQRRVEVKDLLTLTENLFDDTTFTLKNLTDRDFTTLYPTPTINTDFFAQGKFNVGTEVGNL